MKDVVGITIGENGRVYYFDPNNFKLKAKETVIVETDQGLQYGTVAKEKFKVNPKDLKSELKKVIRITTKDDYYQHLKNIKDAKEAVKKCQKLIVKN